MGVTTKECINKSVRILGIGIKKATSYKMVKGRLSRGMYSDHHLQERLKYESSKREKVD